MIEKINYIADDGKIFDNFEDCVVYDNNCELKNEIFKRRKLFKLSSFHQKSIVLL